MRILVDSIDSKQGIMLCTIELLPFITRQVFSSIK